MILSLSSFTIPTPRTIMHMASMMSTKNVINSTPTSCDIYTGASRSLSRWRSYQSLHEKDSFEHLHSSGPSATLTASHLGGLCNSAPLTLIGQQITAELWRPITAPSQSLIQPPTHHQPPHPRPHHHRPHPPIPHLTRSLRRSASATLTQMPK